MQMQAIPENALPATPLQAARRQEGKGGAENPAAVKKVARDFEAVFVAMMLKSMRETVGKESVTGGGRGEETFRSLLDQEYANAAVQGGGIGLAQTLERELSRGDTAAAAGKEVSDAD